MQARYLNVVILVVTKNVDLKMFNDPVSWRAYSKNTSRGRDAASV